MKKLLINNYKKIIKKLKNHNKNQSRKYQNKRILYKILKNKLIILKINIKIILKNSQIMMIKKYIIKNKLMSYKSKNN